MQIPIHFYLGGKKSFHSSLGWTNWAELFCIASVGFLAHHFEFTFVFVFCWVSSSSWNLENFTLLALPQSHPGPAIPVLWSFHHSPPVNVLPPPILTDCWGKLQGTRGNLHGSEENEVSLLQRLDLLKKLISVNAIRTMSLSDHDLGKKVYKEPFINPVYNTKFLGFSMYSVPDLEQKFLYCLVVRKGH